MGWGGGGRYVVFYFACGCCEGVGGLGRHLVGMDDRGHGERCSCLIVGVSKSSVLKAFLLILGVEKMCLSTKLGAEGR